MANYSKISLKDGKLLLEGTEGNSPWQSAYNTNKSFGLSGIEQVNGGVLAYGNRGSDGRRIEKFYSNFNLNDSNSINNLLAQNFNYTPSANQNNNQVNNNSNNQNNTPNLNTPGNNTSSPNIIDSSSGNAYINNTKEEITRLEQEQKDWDELQKKQLNQNIADVEADYAAREEKAKQSYKEMGGTQDVTQFRLGQSGTPYQAAEKAKLEKDKLNYFNALSNEKASKISQLKSAYETNNFKAVSALRNSIYNLKQQQEAFLEQQRTAQLEEAKAAIEASKMQKKESEEYISNVIPAIYENLPNDPTQAIDYIKQMSNEYGVDSNFLMSKMITYKTDVDKQNLLNSTSIAGLLSKTKTGGSVNVPGLGMVEILGQSEEDKAPTTLKAGGKIYNWAGGKWTDTGIKDSDFTPSNIIDALTKIGDTDALAAYLQGQGISTGEFTGGEGMRTDRHNNPTAMTTDVAKNGGLVEGVDYVKGDPFTTESGKTLYTAKLLGDPVETTIRAIDNMSFTTSSGNNRWSYTNQIPGANNQEWPNLSYEQKASVIKEMYKREGGNGSIFSSGGDKFDTFTQEQIALSVMPVQTRNSEVELKRALEGIRSGLKQGLTPYEIADNLMGYKVNEKNDFTNNIRNYISQSEKLDQTAPAEFARMINSGNYSGVVTKLENSVLKGTEGKKKETLAIYTNNYGDKVSKLIQDNIDKLGIIKGNWNDKVRKKVVKTEEFQKLSSSLAALVSDWRHEMIGSAATENELKMIEDLIPKVTDNPWNAMEKIKELQYMTLTSANSIRESENLPSLTKDTLIDRNKRVGLYGGTSNIVKFKDPKTGKIKEFNNLTPAQIQSAINQGYEQQ